VVVYLQCKEFCCCAVKSRDCTQLHHCYKKCPVSKQQAALGAAAHLLASSEDEYDDHDPIEDGHYSTTASHHSSSAVPRTKKGMHDDELSKETAVPRNSSSGADHSTNWSRDNQNVFATFAQKLRVQLNQQVATLTSSNGSNCANNISRVLASIPKFNINNLDNNLEVIRDGDRKRHPDVIDTSSILMQLVRANKGTHRRLQPTSTHFMVISIPQSVDRLPPLALLIAGSNRQLLSSLNCRANELANQQLAQHRLLRAQQPKSRRHNQNEVLSTRASGVSGNLDTSAKSTDPPAALTSLEVASIPSLLALNASVHYPPDLLSAVAVDNNHLEQADNVTETSARLNCERFAFILMLNCPKLRDCRLIAESEADPRERKASSRATGHLRTLSLVLYR
jgi:hypothetical protein